MIDREDAKSAPSCLLSSALFCYPGRGLGSRRRRIGSPSCDQ